MTQSKHLGLLFHQSMNTYFFWILSLPSPSPSPLLLPPPTGIFHLLKYPKKVRLTQPGEGAREGQREKSPQKKKKKVQIGYLSPPFSTLGSWVRQVCSKNIVGKEEKQAPFSPRKQSLGLGLSSEGPPGKGGRERAARSVSRAEAGSPAIPPCCRQHHCRHHCQDLYGPVCGALLSSPSPPLPWASIRAGSPPWGPQAVER